MQSYPFTLDANNGFSTIFNAAGDLFVYQRGASTGNTELSVKSDIGGEIDVIPGQRFRLPGKPSRWTIKVKDGVSAVTGKIVIGFGEFDDANTLNKFTLDATLANNVTVSNTPTVVVGNTNAQRVPVTLDPNQVVNIAGQTVQYTNAFSNIIPPAATAFRMDVVFSAAQNPNGAYIEFAEMGSTLTGQGAVLTTTLCVKATNSAGINDGDVVMTAVNTAAANGAANGFSVVNKQLNQRIKVPAGKGLYICQKAGYAAPDQVIQAVLYTLL